MCVFTFQVLILPTFQMVMFTTHRMIRTSSSSQAVYREEVLLPLKTSFFKLAFGIVVVLISDGLSRSVGTLLAMKAEVQGSNHGWGCIFFFFPMTTTFGGSSRMNHPWNPSGQSTG